MARGKREHLVNTALSLFYRDGFHATGIDTIIAEADIAKMTLYNHFESKDALIEACLHDKSKRVMAWLKAEIEDRAPSPRDRILSLFDVLELWFRQKDFKGCIFARAAGEFPKQDHPVHLAAAAHTTSLFIYLQQQAKAAGAHNPGALAEQIILLLEGAISVAHSTGATIAARRARRAAYRLSMDMGRGPVTSAPFKDN